MSSYFFCSVSFFFFIQITPYGTETDLQKNLEKKLSWDAYRNVTFKNTVQKVKAMKINQKPRVSLHF